jgi:rubrerythrin
MARTNNTEKINTILSYLKEMKEYYHDVKHDVVIEDLIGVCRELADEVKNLTVRIDAQCDIISPIENDIQKLGFFLHKPLTMNQYGEQPLFYDYVVIKELDGTLKALNVAKYSDDYKKVKQYVANAEKDHIDKINKEADELTQKLKSMTPSEREKFREDLMNV